VGCVVKVRVEMSGALSRALAASSARAAEVASRGLVDIAEAWLVEAQRQAPAGPYRESLRIRDEGSSVVAGSTSPLASVIERGRRSGRRPPTRSIQKRAGGTNQAAADAAESIASRGSRGLWVVRDARQQVFRDGTMAAIARRTLEEIADLGNGDGRG